MANRKYSGKRIIVTAGDAVTSGAITRQQGFIGIPMASAAIGGNVVLALEGVWEMIFADFASGQPAKGAPLYWNVAGSKLVSTAPGNILAVKCVTAVSAVDGKFDGLLLPPTV